MCVIDINIKFYTLNISNRPSLSVNATVTKTDYRDNH